MKEAKKFSGRKIFVKVDTGDIKTSYEKEINIVRSLQSFKDDVKNEMYDEVRLIEDNLTLYKCDVRSCDCTLAELCSIKDNWAKGIFDYRKFLTKQEIIDLLEQNYNVAAQGLQEITLEDAEKLED